MVATTACHVQRQLVTACCIALFAAAPLLGQGSLGGVIGTTVPKGMRVDEVPAGSAGARASLQPGDIVYEFNGVRVASVEELQAQLGQSRPGATVKLGIIRAGRTYQTTATLQATSDADRLQRRLSDRQRETEDLRRQIDAAKPAKSTTGAQTPGAKRVVDGPGIPPGIYNCRNRTVNGYNVVLTIRITDAGNYTVVGDNSERPGQYRFDAQHNTVNWLSGPLKANTVDNNRAADFEQERIPPAKVLTVYRGLTATRCILSE
ncbi:MAG: PDZ domain-containing protein [bacterium]